MISVLVILNKNSGRSFSPKTLNGVMAKLTDAQIFARQAIATPTSRDETIAIVLQAVLNHVTHVAVWGGDGTINAVLQGIMQAAADKKNRPVLILLGGGSGSDFLRFRRTLPPRQAMATDIGIVDCLDSGERRWFLNGFSLGVTAQIAAMKETMPRSLPGRLKYLFATVKRLLQGQLYHHLILDAQTQGLVLSLLVLNGRFVGAGMRIKADAAINDGMLDVVLIPRLGLLAIASALLRAYTTGVSAHPGVRCRALTERLKIETTQPLAYETDGETGLSSRLEISVEAGGLNVMILAH
jgi:diacylglycerol kinase (ATP)